MSLFSDEQLRKWRLFNGPQRDPTAIHKKKGVPYFRRGQGRVLQPADFMPVGEHARKHMHAVPKEYLLWVDRQLWSKLWTPWDPVSDFISRYITCDPETSQTIAIPPDDILFVDPLMKHETKIKCFQAGSAHLHTLPGFEDLLHAFTVGALNLSRDWYQPGRLPHYDLTVGKHAQALRLGAQLITREQLMEHQAQWKTFFQTKPEPSPGWIQDEPRGPRPPISLNGIPRHPKP